MSHDADAAFSGFLSECIAAGPSRCALAQGGATAASLEKDLYALFESLKYSPIALPPSAVRYGAIFAGTIIDYSAIKNLILATLYHPFNFPSMATGLNGILTGNLTAMVEWRNFYDSVFSTAIQAEALIGIRCGDKTTRASSVDGVLPSLREGMSKSKLGGSSAI